MKKLLLFSFFLVFFSASFSQSWQSMDTVKAYGDYQNIYLRKLYADSLVSSFVIFIKKEVKLHKHVFHAEHVYVLEGEGDMALGEKEIKVKKGDIIFIPKGSSHSLRVTSSVPVKIISVQSPFFDGKDRVMVGEK